MCTAGMSNMLYSSAVIFLRNVVELLVSGGFPSCLPPAEKKVKIDSAGKTTSDVMWFSFQVWPTSRPTFNVRFFSLPLLPNR